MITHNYPFHNRSSYNPVKYIYIYIKCMRMYERKKNLSISVAFIREDIQIIMEGFCKLYSNQVNWRTNQGDSEFSIIIL